MTREDIIRMAQECRLIGMRPHLDGIYEEALQLFAALVISQHVKETRPEVADSMATWLQQIAYQHGGIGDLCRTEMEFGAMVAAAEREACAKECELLGAERPLKDRRDNSLWRITSNRCAAAIRARREEGERNDRPTRPIEDGDFRSVQRGE